MSKLQTEPIVIPGNKLGIKTDFPEQFLDKAMSPYSRNIEYVDGVLAGRGGLNKLDSTQLKGAVLLMDQFYLFDGTNYFIVCTTKDIAYYDFSSSYYVYLTPLEQTGLVLMGTGTAVLKAYGSGTSWMSSVSVGDYFKLGTGSINSSATWYEVASVDTGTQITLVSAPTGNGYMGYTIRKLFNCGSTNYWSSTVFQDSTLGETWIATNGVDTPVRWSGSGQVVPISTGLATSMTTARYVASYKDRLFWAWTEEGANQPQRVRWSAVANCESIDDDDFEDFVDDQSWITGLTIFSDYLAIFKERGAMIGRYVGGDYTFDFEVSTVPVGCYASNSIVANADNIYYYGVDNKFHRWNFLREEDISTDILPWTKDFDPNTEQGIFGWEVEWKNQIRWFVPHGSTNYNNHVIVYDYEQDIIEIWDTSQSKSLSCMGEYVRTADLYFDDSVYGEEYFDDELTYFDDRTFIDAAPVLVYGGYDGYVRRADTGTDDDGTAYTREFKTKRLDFRYPAIEKRLWEQEWAFNTQTTGSVTLTLYKGDKTDPELTTKTISMVNSTQDVIRKEVTWDKTAYTFQFDLKSTDHFELIGFLNHWLPKGKTFR